MVGSEHPIVIKTEDAKVGLVTHAVVNKVFEKHLQVEFYNGTKGVVLHREARWVRIDSMISRAFIDDF